MLGEFMTAKVHLIPPGDVIGHEKSDDCPCFPEPKPVDTGILVVHNPWDGRDWWT